MILYAALLCGLLFTANGQDITVTIGGDVESGKTLDSKLGDTVLIKCEFSEEPKFSTPPSINYKKTADSEVKQIFASTIGELQEPWKSDTTKYEKGSGLTAPYFISLKINGVSKEDSGIYICMIQRDATVISESQATISVAANIEQVVLERAEERKYAVVDDNREKTITCIAYNGSQPTMALTIDGNPVAVLNVDLNAETETYTFTYQYKFKPEENGKTIRCEAKVPGYESDAVVASAILQIKAAPKLDCPEEVQGDLNKDVTIECTLTANSAITDIQWTRFNRGDVVGDNEEKDIVGLKSTTKKVSEGKYESTLKISLIFEEYFGKYILTAISDGQSADKDIQVIKRKKQQVSDGGNGASTLAAFTSLIILNCYLLLL